MSLAPIHFQATESFYARRRLGPVTSPTQVLRMASVLAAGLLIATMVLFAHGIAPSG